MKFLDDLVIIPQIKGALSPSIFWILMLKLQRRSSWRQSNLRINKIFIGINNNSGILKRYQVWKTEKTVEVSTNDTVYMCSFFKGPNIPKKHHMIGVSWNNNNLNSEEFVSNQSSDSLECTLTHPKISAISTTQISIVAPRHLAWTLMFSLHPTLVPGMTATTLLLNFRTKIAGLLNSNGQLGAKWANLLYKYFGFCC